MGLSINSSTGLITGTVTAGDSSVGSYFPTITVTDGTNSAMDFFEWDIYSTGSLVFANPGSQTNVVGTQVALFVQAVDNAGGTPLYAASGLPDGLYLNSFTGMIFGTIASDAVSASPYPVIVDASDGSYNAAQSFTWQVKNAAGPVTLTNPGDQTNNEGDSVSLTLSGSDTISGHTLSYAAFGLPSGLSINAGTGLISGTVAVGDSAYGPYTVMVTANDGTVFRDADVRLECQ